MSRAAGPQTWWKKWFIRLHRSWVVNVDQIQELQSWFHGSHLLVLRHGRQVPVGRKYAKVITGLASNET